MKRSKLPPLRERIPANVDQPVLEAAIWASACTYCGAKPTKACKRKPRGWLPRSTTTTPHMARVLAGHDKARAEK